jgi:hypothetical protein
MADIRNEIFQVVALLVLIARDTADSEKQGTALLSGVEPSCVTFLLQVVLGSLPAAMIELTL